MVSAWLVFSPTWLNFDCAVSEVVATIAPLFLRLSLSSLVARLIGSLHLELNFRPNNESVGPVAVGSGLPWILSRWRSSYPSVLVPLLAHFSFSLSAAHRFQLSTHFDKIGPIISGRQDGPVLHLPFDLATWAMVRRVNARRR